MIIIIRKLAETEKMACTAIEFWRLAKRSGKEDGKKDSLVYTSSYPYD
jgi:hypothetical protein